MNLFNKIFLFKTYLKFIIFVTNYTQIYTQL